MGDKNDEQTIQPLKAVGSLISNLLLLVGGPYLIKGYVLPTYAPAYAAYFTPEIFNYIITLGVISGAITFFKVLWKPGTRPHGFFNIIFAVYSAYYVLALFGGLGTYGSGGFGIMALELAGFTIAIDLTIVAYVIIGQAVITVIVYFMEMLL